MRSNLTWMLLCAGLSFCACVHPVVNLPGEGIYEAAPICRVENPEPMPDGEKIENYWLVGKGTLGRWSRELAECETLRTVDRVAAGL